MVGGRPCRTTRVGGRVPLQLAAQGKGSDLAHGLGAALGLERLSRPQTALGLYARLGLAGGNAASGRTSYRSRGQRRDGHSRPARNPAR
jgi:hypothetical protein